MILDLKFEGKHAVIVGGGSEAYRKILSFMEADAKILVVSRSFLDEIHTLHHLKKIDLQKKEIKDAKEFFKDLNPTPDLLLAVTNNQKLNLQLVKTAKSAGCMVYAVDNPTISDFIVPALAKIEDVQIAVSTSGKSPTVARVLRKG